MYSLGKITQLVLPPPFQYSTHSISSSDEKYDSTSDTSCLAAVKKEARRLGLCPRRHFVSKNMATRTSPSRVGSLRAMHHAINMKLSINFELTIDFEFGINSSRNAPQKNKFRTN